MKKRYTAANGFVLLLLAGVILLVLVFTGIPTPVAGGAGYLAAHWDVARGHYEVMIPRSYARKETLTFLRTHYGIKTRMPGGSCWIPPETIAYGSAYQSVVRQAIKAKYGRDVVAESMADWKGPFYYGRSYELNDFATEMRGVLSSRDFPRIREVINAMQRSLEMMDPPLDQASKDKLTQVLGEYLLINKDAQRPEARELRCAAIFALQSTGGEAAAGVLQQVSRDPDASIAKAARETKYLLE